MIMSGVDDHVNAFFFNHWMYGVEFYILFDQKYLIVHAVCYLKMFYISWLLSKYLGSDTGINISNKLICIGGNAKQRQNTKINVWLQFYLLLFF